MKNLKLVLLVWFTISAFSSTTTFHKFNTPSKITLDFQAIEIRQALQILAKFININLLVEDSVQGKMSIHLSEVPAEEAIQAILHMQDLSQELIGTTWVIRPQSHSTTPQSDRPTSLTTKRITLNHREAKEIADIFLGKNNTHKTRVHDLSIDARTNSLWIQGTAKQVQLLEEVVQAFDHPIQQILIEARIVSVDRNFERTLGLRLGLKNPMPENIEPSSTQTPDQATSSFTPALHVDLPIHLKSFASQVPWLGNINQLLDLELSAMENEGNLQIVARPRLITMDRTTALIEAGSELPYQEKGRYGNTNLSFKKAALSLKVTPELTQSGKIVLKLHINHDKPSTLHIQETPAIDTQELKTQVLINSGETVILGGIYENINQKKIQGLPLLSKLPLIGRVFTHQTKVDKTHELLIFVTPHLLSNTLSKKQLKS